MNELPQPLTPADCDLRDFQFMPLDVVRLRDSDLASEQTPEENWAALLLWSTAWHQVPAGSIPDSDNWIAKAAGYMARGRIDPRWKEVRAGAMRGFILCNDGRWYHPVVAEKAAEAWISKLRQRHKTECGRIKKHNERHDMKLPYPDFEAWMEAGYPSGHSLPVPSDAAATIQGRPSSVTSETHSKGQYKGQGQGQYKGQGQLTSKPNPSSVPPPAGRPTEKSTTAKIPETVPTWDAYAKAYHDRYGVAPVRNAKVNGMLANLVKRLGQQEAPLVAAFYLRHQGRNYVLKLHSVDLLLHDCEKLRTEWATQTQMTSSRADQQDRTQANYDAFAPLIAEAEAQEAMERSAYGAQ